MKLPNIHNPLALFAPALAGPALGAAGATGGNMMFASSGSGSGSGSGGYDDDDYTYDDDYGYEDEPTPAEPARTAPRSNRTRRSAGGDGTGGRSRSGSYQPEERYWTDYLRIALPVIGIVLMLGVLWIWASSLIGGDSDDNDTNNDDNIALVETQTADANEVNTEPTSASTPGNSTAGEIPISNTTTETPAVTTEAPFNPTQTETPTSGGDDVSDATTEADSGEITEDGFVVTTDEVNMRDGAGTSANVVRVVPAGENFQVIGGPEEADGFTWWNVVSDVEGDSGWIAEQFLEVAP